MAQGEVDVRETGRISDGAQRGFGLRSAASWHGDALAGTPPVPLAGTAGAEEHHERGGEQRARAGGRPHVENLGLVGVLGNRPVPIRWRRGGGAP